MDEQLTDVKPAPDPSTEVVAETVPQDVKPENDAITEEVAPKTANQGVPYERFREVNEKAKALEDELRKQRESSVSSEQLAKEYPDWDMMTESERWMAKKVINLEEKVRWEEDLKKAQKIYPALGEKEAEFKDYAYKFPKSVDIEVLAKSFLFDKVTPPVPEPAATPKKGLEKPTGGSRQAPAPGLGLGDIKRLREEQPRVYEKMLREGKLPKILPTK